MCADRSYPWTRFISIGWPQPRATPNAAQSAPFQRDMSRYRIAVEWGFHDVTALFRFIDDVSEQKILLQPVSRTYRVAIFLKNCHICINQSSTTAQYFECDPPGLSEYLPWA